MINIKRAIVDLLKRARFDEGYEFFRTYGASLSEPERLECEGDFYFYRRDFSAAVKKYEEVIRKYPDHPVVRYQYLVGVQEEREQNYVDAFKRYQAAISIEPDFEDAYVELGGLLVKVDDFEGAAQCFRDAARIDPLDLANAHNLKAVLTYLAKCEPARYQEELRAAEAAYENLAQHTPQKSISAHTW